MFMKRPMIMKTSFQVPIHESEKIFRMLTHVSNDMIHVCDRDGRILFANPATSRFIGYAIDDLIGTPTDKVIHPDNLKTIKSDMERLPKDGSLSPAREIRLIRKDGSHINVNRVAMLLGSMEKRNYIGIIFRNTSILKTSARTLVATNEKLQQEIGERKLIAKKLTEKKAVLQDKAKSLEEINVALNVLLRKREKDRTHIEERICSNIEDLVIPYLEKMMQTNLTKHQKAMVDILRSNLKDVTSNFLQKLSSRSFNLSPAELKVANQIQRGKRTKEIAEILNISIQTVKNHRHKIRTKIGIKNKKMGLANYLSTLT